MKIIVSVTMNETHSNERVTTKQLVRNALFYYLSSSFPLKGNSFKVLQNKETLEYFKNMILTFYSKIILKLYKWLLYFIAYVATLSVHMIPSR